MGLFDWFRRQKRLLSEKEERRIEEAIREAERKTSAEIRVVVEDRYEWDPLGRAVDKFEELGMTATKERNGVLIYVALEDRKFAIVGDIGIHEHVGDEFWEEVTREMESKFKEGDIVGGIVSGVERAGEVLAKYFPRDEEDENELPDEIVY